MKFIFLLLSLSLSFVSSEKMIRNMKNPACRNCIHYSPDTFNDFSSPLNKCENFGVKDIISDKITYDYADLCRKDDSKCGKEGKYFEEEKNINMKIAKHAITSPYIIINNIYLITFFAYILIIYNSKK